jgi:DHA1 family tetracycline resistance protein-like MFS transporter
MKRNAGLGFIFVTLLIDVMGSGLLFPILPRFIATLSHAPPNEASLHYGWLLSLFGAMQFLFAPLFGTLSDRFGRRPVLLVALLFTGLDYVIMALAPSLPWLYLGRILSGITGASVTTATAYIADVSPPEKRAQNFGLVGAAFGLGFILGPAAGGLLGALGERVPFWTAAALSFANLAYGWFVLPESLKPENRRDFQWREANPLGALRMLGRYPVVWGLAGALVASNLGMHILGSTWVLAMTAMFGWAEAENGLSLAAFGLIALVYQLGVARVLLPRLGERRTMLLSLAFSIVECAAYAIATQGWMIYAIMVVAGLAFLASQVMQGFLSHQVGDDEQGALQGALTSLSSLTGIAGPVVGTSIFAYFTAPQTPARFPGAPFILSAALNAVALFITVRALRRLQPAREERPRARIDQQTRNVESSACEGSS